MDLEQRVKDSIFIASKDVTTDVRTFQPIVELTVMIRMPVEIPMEEGETLEELYRLIGKTIVENQSEFDAGRVK